MLENHRKKSPEKVACAIITVSDTRDFHTDKSGRIIEQMLTHAGHLVKERVIIKDELIDLIQLLNEWLDYKQIDAIIFNGGTGIGKRDITIEAVKPFLDKELPGFGELFRYYSFTEDIGTASIMSRAIAGVANDKAVFSIPGSSGAVRLALEKIILPEIGHIVMEIKKDL